MVRQRDEKTNLTNTSLGVQRKLGRFVCASRTKAEIKEIVIYSENQPNSN